LKYSTRCCTCPDIHLALIAEGLGIVLTGAVPDGTALIIILADPSLVKLPHRRV